MEVGGQRPHTRSLRDQWTGTLILNPDTRPQPTGLDALSLIEDGTTDLVAFGQLFIANPDLPRRLAVGGPFNQADRSKSFGGDHRGYIDYPTLDEQPDLTGSAA